MNEEQRDREPAGPAPASVPGSALRSALGSALGSALPVDVSALLTLLAGADGADGTDAELVTGIDALERVKAACAAAQARLTARFVQSQAVEAERWREQAQACSDAGDFDGWVVARDRARALELPADQRQAEAPGVGAGGGRERESGSSRRRRAALMARTGVSGQVGLARRESPARGARLARASLALVQDLSHTLAALTAGVITERRAEIVARVTSHLSAEQRAVVDAEVIGANLPPADSCDPSAGVGGWGDRELERRLRACADRLDPEAAAARARAAAKDRHVSIRPMPDCMAVVRAMLPVQHAVAVHAALTEAAGTAKAAGDPRSRGQVMADTLTERVTGQDSAADVEVEVQVVITDRALLHGESTPAHVPGYGTVPAGWVRDLLSRDLFTESAQPDGANPDAAHAHALAESCEPWQSSEVAEVAEAARTWLRRLYTHPATGTLVAMDSTRRLFPPGLRRYLVARDGVCRTPWCDAPIRHADHVRPYAAGGSTSDTNGQGLCVACNLTKDLPGWRSEVMDVGPTAGSRQAHAVRMTTPTGHAYTSSAPPLLPGHLEPAIPADAEAAEDTEDAATLAGPKVVVIDLYRPTLPHPPGPDGGSVLEAVLARRLAS